jgi:hypothetical protein
VRFVDITIAALKFIGSKIVDGLDKILSPREVERRCEECQEDTIHTVWDEYNGIASTDEHSRCTVWSQTNSVHLI